jgi:hypothetical protein
MPGAEEFHFDGRHRFTLELGDFRNGVILNVEEIEDCTLPRRKKIHRSMQPVDLALEVEIILKVGTLGNETLVNHFEIFGRMPAAPVVANSVVRDLPEQCERMCHLADAPKGFHRMQRNILLQIFVMNKTASSPGFEANDAADIRKINDHVTVFPD